MPLIDKSCHGIKSLKRLEINLANKFITTDERQVRQLHKKYQNMTSKIYAN